MTTIETRPLDSTTRPTRRTVPFGPTLAATALLVGAGGNTIQAVLGQVLGGRPDTVVEQAALATERGGLVTATALVGTLAVPFMVVGFVAAAHLLARRARRTGWVAGVLLVIGMWGFLAVQTTELIQLTAVTDGPAGLAAASWLQGMDSVPLMGAVFGIPFMAGCVLGMLTLTIGMLVTGAGVPRWIPAAWLVFILLDFTIRAVGPVDPHWLYLAGAVGLAHHITRDGARVWKNE